MTANFTAGTRYPSVPRTMQDAIEEKFQFAIATIRDDMARGSSKTAAITSYLERATFGPALVARLHAELEATP